MAYDVEDKMYTVEGLWYSGGHHVYRVSEKRVSIKNFNSDLFITLIALDSVDLYVLFDIPFVILTYLIKI